MATIKTVEQAQRMVLIMMNKRIHGQATDQDVESARRIRDLLMKVRSSH